MRRRRMTGAAPDGQNQPRRARSDLVKSLADVVQYRLQLMAEIGDRLESKAPRGTLHGVDDPEDRVQQLLFGSLAFKPEEIGFHPAQTLVALGKERGMEAFQINGHIDQREPG